MGHTFENLRKWGWRRTRRKGNSLNKGTEAASGRTTAGPAVGGGDRKPGEADAGPALGWGP